jgi:hypothetical protein
MPFVGGEITFGVTCAPVPDPDFFVEVFCIFAPAVFVSCVGVFVKIVQLLS